MALTLKSMLREPGGAYYYTSAWRLLVETHLVWLRATAGSDTLTILPHIGYKYEGDLYGALTELKIPPYMHWVVLRMNGLYSPTDYDGQSVVLMIPLPETLQQLASLASTTQNKII